MGMVKRIHGQNGELLIKPLTENVADRFGTGSVLFMTLKRGQERVKVKVLSSRMTDRGPLVRFEGYARREEAWPLFGASLFIPIAELAEPEEGRYYAFQLEGCEVLAGSRRVGEVTKIVETPKANPYLEVDPGGEEPQVLIPFVSQVVRSIDLKRRQIEIAEDFLP